MMDERMKQGIYKVRNEIASWMYLAIVVSFVVKQLVFQWTTSQCLLELCIMIAVPLYQFIRLRTLEINVDYRAGNRRIFSVVVGTVVCMVVFGLLMIRNGNPLDIGAILINGLCFAAAFTGLRFLVTKLADRHNRQMEEKYEDEEDETPQK